MKSHLDALIVVPPLSPSDTNPPLGPYLLRRCFERAGLRLDVADLSVKYLNRFRSPGSIGSSDGRVGDQDKDRRLTHAARDHFVSTNPLMDQATLHVPCSADPVLGMHFGFDAIDRAVDVAAVPTSFWRDFVQAELFDRVDCRPGVLGISIMGPSQVFVGLLVAKLARELWPGAPIVAGGSHVTLLIDAIASDSRYGVWIDRFLPGHCEHEFVQLVRTFQESGSLPAFGVVAGQGQNSELACKSPRAVMTIKGKSRHDVSGFELCPLILPEDLIDYSRDRVTLPMQLTRGCVFGRCTYCTYPAAEPVPTLEPDWNQAVCSIRTMVDATGVRRFSFKDSLFTPKNLRTLSDLLSDEGLGIKWSATTLLNARLTPGLLEIISKAGCRTLEVGLETTDHDGQEKFRKPLDMNMVEEVIASAAVAGIVMVLNQILGWPGQTRTSAARQVEWYSKMLKEWPDHVRASFNMLEINRGSPMAQDPAKFGLDLSGIAPWAFSYAWNAPAWRRCFPMPDAGGEARLAAGVNEAPVVVVTTRRRPSDAPRGA